MGRSPRANIGMGNVVVGMNICDRSRLLVQSAVREREEKKNV